MFDPNFVADYINAVRAHGFRSPIVPVSSLTAPLTGARIDAFIGYSVIPITSAGQLAASTDSVAFVAMPHVFKRKNQGCGDRIDPARAKEAGLNGNGFGPKQGTPYAQQTAAMATARALAEDLLGRIVRVYGLPGVQPAAAGAPDVAVAKPAIPKVGRQNDLRAATGSPATAALPGADDDEFFYYLLGKVKAAFEDADICSYQRQRGLEWWYAVCALPFRRGSDLLIGLKWGVNPSANHHPQVAPPTAAEVAEVQSYRFISRSRPFLEKYVAPLSGFNYINVCPFRAPKLTYLTSRDWQFAIDHFFLEAIDYLKPPKTVIIGITDVKVLAERGLVESEPVRVSVEGKTETGYRGVIRGSTGHHPFGAVPQPTYAMTNEARHALWAAVFDG